MLCGCAVCIAQHEFPVLHEKCAQATRLESEILQCVTDIESEDDVIQNWPSERRNVAETPQSWRRYGSAGAELHAQPCQVRLYLVQAQMLRDKVCGIFCSCNFCNCKLLFSHLLLHPKIPDIEVSKFPEPLPAHDAKCG